MAGQVAIDFMKDQVLNMNPVSAPLWILGLLYSFLSRADNRLKVAGYVYITTAAILLLSPASRSGYLSPAYPALFACGALALELWLPRVRILPAAYAIAILAFAALILPLAIPVLPVEKYISFAAKMGVAPSTEERKEVGALPQFYADMFGWNEMAQQVAAVYNALPPAERDKAYFFGSNYGEAGAIGFYKNEFSLPPAISTHNNYWLWGPGDFSGDLLIMLGGSKERKQIFFEDVREAGEIQCGYCMPYENHKTIFICRRLKVPLQQAWNEWKHYD